MNSSITGNGTSHIYYNITLTNNDTSDTHFPPPISFTETRNSPFINCPEDYFMSVVRFAMDTPTLPVLTCQPDIRNASGYTVNTLIYEVFLSYRGVTARQQVEFEPQNIFSQPPINSPLKPEDIQSEYYNVYNYQWFIDMVNTTLQICFVQLQAFAIIAGTPLPDDFTRPLLAWDSGSNVAILQQNITTANFGINKPGLEIYFNTALYELFNSFIFTSGFVPGITPQVIGHKFFVETGLNAIVSTLTTTPYPPEPPVSNKYFNMIQEYSTVGLWSPVDSIVFTTSMLPLTPELQAAPVVYNTNGVFESVGSNANLTNVLTDFIVPGNEYKPTVNYTPSAEYRMVDLFGTNACSSIQVNVYYKNKFGSLIPVLLGFGCSASIKILFRRKDFSNLIVS
jgi:hypothetical protein